ncbi:hypothetical protein NW801_21870 [Brevibacillus laterosporus]|uniref:Uncharacterized protein n=1 Tax=Brevibacillus halotolerans TaxID=1507437 RepID=A0ABT4I2V6_9BACL|nr:MULTISPECIES: hypothetical protein [Brevibacillus]MCR8987640.1 hypothetical protein [Brevibacillus laterosporus]MCZ0833379.1 hypothetical protein [Brevibacillus halotolerans]
MDKVLLVILSLAFFIRIEMFQNDQLVNRLVNARLKYSIDRGAHDASLQIDEEAWGNGYILFVKEKALETFKSTLGSNISVDPVSLVPHPNTLLKDKIHIIYEDYIDHEDNVSYPYYYQNEQYNIHKWIYGPAVIYVVKVMTPKIHPTSLNEYIQKSVVFEYPFPSDLDKGL